MTRNRSPLAVALCIIVAVVVTGVDLGSKSWAFERLSEAPYGEAAAVCTLDSHDQLLGMQRRTTSPIVLVDDVLEFRYAENCGAAFGLMNNQSPVLRKAVFGIAAVAATLVLLFMFFRNRGGRYFATAVPFIIAGAMGNFYDRFTRGYVIDFVRFHWKDVWSYPTFNVADVAITVGVALLVIEQIRDWRAERNAKVES